MNLLELEIFNNDLTLNSDLSKELWDEFAKQSFFFIGQDFRKKFHTHCHYLQSKISNAYKVENSKTSLNDINIIQQSPDHKIQIE